MQKCEYGVLEITCDTKVSVVTCEYIDLKIVPSIYVTNCSIVVFNNANTVSAEM